MAVFGSYEAARAHAPDEFTELFGMGPELGVVVRSALDSPLPDEEG